VRVLTDIHRRNNVSGAEALILQFALRASEVIEDRIQPVLEYRNASGRERNGTKRVMVVIALSL
jgi:hypothetical protein